MALRYISSKNKNSWPIRAKLQDYFLEFNQSDHFVRSIIAGSPKAKSDTINLYHFFSPSAKKIWKQGSHSGIELFSALLEDYHFQIFAKRLTVPVTDIAILLKNYRQLQSNNKQEQPLYRLPFVAYEEMIRLGQREITSLTLLCALVTLLPQEHIIQSILTNIHADKVTCEIISAWILSDKNQLAADPEVELSSLTMIAYCLKASALEKIYHNFFSYRTIAQAVTKYENDHVAILQKLIAVAKHYAE